jgi:Uma2 family endonuclease
MTVQAQRLLTAEEFAVQPDDGRRTELVKGVVVEMPPTNFRHGVACNRIGRILGTYVEEHGLGWVLNNDAGVVTQRDPDTVRGPDVAYFSFSRLPKDSIPDKYPAVSPELVVEVKSPSDRVSHLSAKAGEYLDAGAVVVLVVDPDTESVAVFTQNELPRRLSNGDELALPELFPDFRVPVRQFFA